jgi:hypothetical protein
LSNVVFSNGATSLVIERRTLFSGCEANGTINDCAVGVAPALTFTVGGGSTASFYFRVYTVETGGSASFDISLTCNNPPGVSQQPQSQTVTAGNAVTLVALPTTTGLPTTIQWRKNGVNISGATSPGLTFNPVQLSDAGVYDAVFINPCGSTTTNAATLTVNCPPASISVSESSGTPNDGIVCINTGYTVVATGGGTYLWDNGSTFPFVSVGPALATTTHSVTVTNNGCTTALSQTVTVLSPAASIAISENSGANPNDGNICQGAPVTLTASGGGTYAWSHGLGSNPVVNVNPMFSTTYIVTVTDQGCSATATASIVVNILSGGGDAVYEQPCGLIYLNGGGNGDQFLWQGPNEYSSNAATSTVNPAVSGVYTLTMTQSSTGCSAVVYTSPNIAVQAGAPFFNVTGGGSACPAEGGAVGLDGSETGTDYQLYLGNDPVGTPVAGTGAVISFGNQSVAGAYTVVATITGCPEDLPMNGSAVVTFVNCDDGDPCTNDICSAGVCSHPPADADGDGSPCGVDCDDNDPENYPDNSETCDGQDNDCDGQADEEGGTTWYQDLDSDTYGNPNVSLVACSQPAGYVSDNTDCNDNVFSANPGATEVCDGIDNDCDNFIDENLSTTYYFDQDNDGFGNNANSITVCITPPAGYITTGDDCDDGNPAINPDAEEICNGFDDDCDGTTDEDAGPLWYADADGDGFGNSSVSQQSCSQPTGFVSNSTDCNDGNPAVTNCDDGDPCTVDACVEGACVHTPLDADNDGVPCQSDCNDNNAAVGICNDNDPCTADACVEGACSFTPIDNDGDGSVCGVDCNDNVNTIYPGATEVCDGLDNDCDENVDEGLLITYYFDLDGDNYGNSANAITVCITPPTGYITTSGDCDDSNATINPGAVEICNGLDDDCDGLVDEGVLITWYVDWDMDGYGDSNQPTYTGCSPPNSMYAPVGGDCEDEIASIHPNAPEVCNYLDDDCDGTADDGLTFIAYYDEHDGDGFGEYFIGNHCAPPANSATQPGDCNNWNASVYPGATETCNWLDDDCDGQVDEGVQGTFYADMDGDGYGNPNITAGGCSPPNGFVLNDDDCNDNIGSIHPGATETCNGFDDDCDGQVDEGLTFQSYWSDNDHDGYGQYLLGSFCTPPANSATQSGDCNDWNSNIRPGATEICNWQDDDCDGQIDEGAGPTWYQDLDGDSYGNPSVTTAACSQPAGYVSNNQDCNDNNAAIKPGAVEICDGLDNNCDGTIDNVPAGIDLIVQSASAPGSAGAGAQITVSGIIKNLGATNSGNNSVRWYLSNDQIINSGDYSPTSWRTATNSIGSCGTKNFSKTVSLPASGWNGVKYLIFKADGLNQVGETNEGNNLLILTITINPPVRPGVSERAVGFTATRSGYSAALYWLARFEQPVVKMEVERSVDGSSFDVLKVLNDSVGANETATFRYLDEATLAGLNTWRIRFYLADGATVFTPVRSLYFEENDDDFLVFPNPAGDYVHVYMNRFKGKEVDFLISNSLGQVLYRQHIEQVTDGNYSVDLPGEQFKDGVYFVSIVHKGRAFTRRLVVARY